MHKKVLAFVYDGEKYLALRNNYKDPTHGGDYWFTVTGGVEGKESYQEAVIREVMEETGLEVEKIFDLNWSSKYTWQDQDHEESNFLAIVTPGQVTLNEEHVDWIWLPLNKFVAKLNWGLNKRELKSALEKATQGKAYFKARRIEDLRK